MVPAGFGPRTCDRGANLLFGYVLGFTALEAPRWHPKRARRSTSARTSSRRATARWIRRRCRSRWSSQPDAARFVDDEQFEWGLRAILDGIAARHPGD